MKKIILISILLFTTILSSFSQTISPLETTEQCPGVNITFSVSIVAKSIQSVYGTALNISPDIVQQPF